MPGRLFAVTDGDSRLYEVEAVTGASTFVAEIGNNICGLWNPGVMATPAETSTWGAIKHHFK